MRLPELPGYQLEELLGEDSFGWSFIASGPDGEKRVVRVLKAQATNDLLIYQSFKKFMEPDFDLAGVAEIDAFAFQDRDTLTAYAMPFYGGQNGSGTWSDTSLSRLMPLIEDDQAIDLVGTFAKRLGEIHQAGIFHGGLRPSNVFVVDDGESGKDIRLGQFGEAFIAGTQYLESGELMFYVSPEQIASGDFSGNKIIAWDVYSFGVIAFQMLTGHLPRLDTLYQQYQEDREPLDRLPAIAHGQLTVASGHFTTQLEKEKSLEWPGKPKSLKDKLIRHVIEKCLAYDSADRFAGMAEAAVAIEEALADWEELEGQAAAAREEISAPVEKTKPAILPAKSDKREKEKAKAQPRTRMPGGPSLFWRIAGVTAMIAVPLLTMVILVYDHNLKQVNRDLQVNNQVNQADIEKQASAYRQILQENRKSKSQLRSELNQVEDSKSRLTGEAKLARHVVRQTQENGDRFFELILDNRDTDVPKFRIDRDKALQDGLKHYERLVEVYGDAPDFIISTANAMFYLGEIHKEMGKFGKALAAFGEAERRYLAVREDGVTPDAAHSKNLARAKRSLGELSMKNGRYSSAIHFFGESSGYWGELRKIDPQQTLDSTIRVQENLLEIAECDRIMNHAGVALDAAYSIGSQLLKIQEKHPDNHQVLSALAKAFALAGRILESKGDIKKAVDAYQQSSNLFAKAVKLNAVIDAYQLGLGNSLARVGLLKNDIKKLQAAVDVLAEVIPQNPYEPTYQKTLADVYGVLAKNQRDGGQRSNAIVLAGRAVSLLRPLIQNNPATPADVKFSYGQRLADLSELLGDSGKYDDSRGPLREAINVFSEIAGAENAKPAYRRALAGAQGLAGFACLNSGDKAAAKSHYKLAQAEWQTYMQLNPKDSDAVRAAKWTKDQLSGLR